MDGGFYGTQRVWAMNPNASILSGKGEAFSHPQSRAEGAFLPHRI